LSCAPACAYIRGRIRLRRINNQHLPPNTSYFPTRISIPGGDPVIQQRQLPPTFQLTKTIEAIFIAVSNMNLRRTQECFSFSPGCFANSSTYLDHPSRLVGFRRLVKSRNIVRLSSTLSFQDDGSQTVDPGPNFNSSMPVDSSFNVPQTPTDVRGKGCSFWCGRILFSSETRGS
jgi:hypothetical protein